MEERKTMEKGFDQLFEIFLLYQAVIFQRLLFKYSSHIFEMLFHLCVTQFNKANASACSANFELGIFNGHFVCL